MFKIQRVKFKFLEIWVEQEGTQSVDREPFTMDKTEGPTL